MKLKYIILVIMVSFFFAGCAVMSKETEERIDRSVAIHVAWLGKSYDELKSRMGEPTHILETENKKYPVYSFVGKMVQGEQAYYFTGFDTGKLTPTPELNIMRVSTSSRCFSQFTVDDDNRIIDYRYHRAQECGDIPPPSDRNPDDYRRDNATMDKFQDKGDELTAADIRKAFSSTMMYGHSYSLGLATTDNRFLNFYNKDGRLAHYSYDHGFKRGKWRVFDKLNAMCEQFEGEKERCFKFEPIWLGLDRYEIEEDGDTDKEALIFNFTKNVPDMW
jgi:regulatory protein YycI of two-component signal transduction system YycFG